MSIQAIAWAISQDTTPSQKLILITLANYADEDGICFPGIDRLAWDTNLSRRSVISHIGRLRKKKLVQVQPEGGTGDGRKSNTYLLSLSSPGRQMPKRSRSRRSVDNFYNNKQLNPQCAESALNPTSNVQDLHIAAQKPVQITPPNVQSVQGNVQSVQGQCAEFAPESLVEPKEGIVSDKLPTVDTKGLDAKTGALITHLLFLKFQECQIRTMVPDIQRWGAMGLKTEDLDTIMGELKARGKMNVAPQYLNGPVQDILDQKFMPSWAKIPTDLEGSHLMRWAEENGYPRATTETHFEYVAKLRALAKRRMAQ